MQDAWYMMHETHRGDAPTVYPNEWTHTREYAPTVVSIEWAHRGGRTHIVTQRTDTPDLEIVGELSNEVPRNIFALQKVFETFLFIQAID